MPGHQEGVNMKKEYGIRVMDEYRNGNRVKAMEAMCENMEPVIKRIIRKQMIPPVYEEDAMQEGRLAVLEAMDKYDPNRSSPDTYFSIYIRHNIYTYINRTVHNTPMYHAEKARAVQKVKRKLESEGLSPTSEEISKASGMSLLDVRRTLAHLERVSQGIYLDDVEITDEDSDTEKAAIKEIDKENLNKALYKVGPRCRDIISMRYGLIGYSPKSVAEIALKYHESLTKVNIEIDKGLLFLKMFLKS